LMLRDRPSQLRNAGGKPIQSIAKILQCNDLRLVRSQRLVFDIIGVDASVFAATQMLSEHPLGRSFRFSRLVWFDHINFPFQRGDRKALTDAIKRVGAGMPYTFEKYLLFERRLAAWRSAYSCG